MIKEKTVSVLSIEIPLHEKSIKNVEEIFSRYSKTKELTSVVRNPTIHLYMKEDTYDKDGSVNGYNDSLFFECHVYDTVNRVKYVSPRLHDKIRFNGFNVESGFFKDGSITYSLIGDFQFSFNQDISVSKYDPKEDDLASIEI